MRDTNKRCQACAYWVAGEQWPGEDDTGSCHRHAPLPTHGDILHEIVKHLTIISWRHADGEQRKHEFDMWENAGERTCGWPTTEASDWCGDWQKHD